MHISSLINKLRSPSSFNHKIARAALIVALCSVFVKFISTLKELAAANCFGRSDVIESFLMAYLVPSFLVALLASSFPSALIPAVIGVRKHQGAAAAQKLISSAMVLSSLLLLSVSVGVAILAPLLFPHIAANFGPEKLQLTLRLLYLMLPVIVIGGLSANCAAILNAEGRFALAASAPFITPAVSLIAILGFARSLGIWCLGVSVLLGSVLELCVVATALQQTQLRFQIKWHGMTREIRGLGNQYGILLLSAALAQGVAVVDQSMAAMLAPGSLAALSYAARVVGVVVTFFSLAITTAVMPYFSEMAVAQRWPECRHSLKTYSRLLFTLTIPVTILLVVGSNTIVRVLFQRGAFSSSDTQIVASVQALYALQIPFYAVGILLVQLLRAMKRNTIVMIGAGINLILDVLLNLLFMRRLGVAGIALSTSIFHCISLIFLWTVVRRILKKSTSNNKNPRSVSSLALR